MTVCKNKYAAAFANQKAQLAKCSTDNQRFSVYLKLLNILVQSPKSAPIYDFRAKLKNTGEPVIVSAGMLTPLLLKHIERMTGKLMAA
jgi:hypothetical protein